MQFYRVEPTARTSWRQVILMGANTRTYKFALGAALLEVAKSGRDAVSLTELATYYTAHLMNRDGDYPQASLARELGDRDFLSVLNQERQQSRADGAPTEALVAAAATSIPGMVMQKFHNLSGQGEVAHRFYELESVGRERIVRLTPDLFAITESASALLEHELDARWRIVEASFDAGIGRNLVGGGVDIDIETEQLLVPVHRVTLTRLRGSIDGFQYGRCFYCSEPLGDLYGADVHVDHVFPFSCMKTGSWRGPDLNGVWNLVLAHAACNLTKSNKYPTNEEIERLLVRNDAIADSPTPLRRTLELAMKASGAKAAEQRRQFIANVHKLVTEGR